MIEIITNVLMGLGLAGVAIKINEWYAKAKKYDSVERITKEVMSEMDFAFHLGEGGKLPAKEKTIKKD